MGSNVEVPDNSRARLRFSILYHRERLELFLMVIEATGLPSQRSTDYAVWVRLLKQVPSSITELQRVVHEWQTQVVKNSRTPVFGDHFVCSLPEAELEKSTVKLEVGQGWLIWVCDLCEMPVKQAKLMTLETKTITLP